MASLSPQASRIIEALRIIIHYVLHLLIALGFWCTEVSEMMFFLLLLEDSFLPAKGLKEASLFPWRHISFQDKASFS